MTDESEKFLSRWSRLKRDTRGMGAEVATPSEADRDAAAGPQRQAKDAPTESAPPPLPPLDELTMTSDFRGYFHPKVGEDLKRAALKKLFRDPHFNVMDGLDTYIDDYSKPDPLPAEMLAQMKSAQKIFKWARNELEESENAPAQLDGTAAPALEMSELTGEGVPAAEQQAGVEESTTVAAARDATQYPELPKDEK